MLLSISILKYWGGGGKNNPASSSMILNLYQIQTKTHKIALYLFHVYGSSSET